MSSVLPLVAAAFITCGFVACSSDDDEGGSVPGGPAATYDGLLLGRTGDMTFKYDDKGRCTDIMLDYEEDGFVHIDYGRRTITIDGETYNIAFNSSGYITSVSLSLNEKEDGYTVNVTGRITCDYDGKGHLTGGRNDFSATASGGGEKYSETEYSSVKYLWDGNLLTQVTCDEETKTNGEVTNKEFTTYTVSYSETANKYCQWTHASETFTMAGDCLGFVGLFGKSSDRLVSSFKKEKTENGETLSPSTTSVSYLLNENGTIETEKCGYSTYYYEYVSQDENDAKGHDYAMKAAGKQNGGMGRNGLLFGFRDKMNAMKERIKAEVYMKQVQDR